MLDSGTAVLNPNVQAYPEYIFMLDKRWQY
jgi:hypothetical protein